MRSKGESPKSTDLKVFVNDRPVTLVQGMTVRHALINTGIILVPGSLQKIYDEWGNEIGLNGSLTSGMKIFVK